MTWASLNGSDRERTCAACERTVHNLSVMTRVEAEALLTQHERLCVCFTRLPDGRIKTLDSRPSHPFGRSLHGVAAALFATLIGVSHMRVSLAARAPAAEVRNDGPALSGARSASAPTPRTIDGALMGTVRDSSGEVLPDADILAESEKTGERFTTKSDTNGRYRLPLERGRYTVVVSLPGFHSSTLSDVIIRLGGLKTVDAELSVGLLGEVIFVGRPPFAERHGWFVNTVTLPFRTLSRLIMD